MRGGVAAFVIPSSGEWKDLRTILFLDYWADLLPDASFVFVFRRPWKVVDSFFRRGDPAFVHNPAFAARVWLNYNRLIVRFITRHPERCVIREITQVSADPQEVFAAVGDRFGIPLGEPTSRFRPESLGAGGRQLPRSRRCLLPAPRCCGVDLNAACRLDTREAIPTVKSGCGGRKRRRKGRRLNHKVTKILKEPAL